MFISTFSSSIVFLLVQAVFSHTVGWPMHTDQSAMTDNADSFSVTDNMTVPEDVWQYIETAFGVSKSDMKDIRCDPPAPEYIQEFKDQQDFGARLHDHFVKTNMMDQYEIISKAWLEPVKTVEQLHMEDAKVFAILEQSGAQALAKEYLLWSGKTTKRMKGLRPEEKMDDRPAVCTRDPLMFGDPMPWDRVDKEQNPEKTTTSAVEREAVGGRSEVRE